MKVTDICSTTTPYVQAKGTQTKSASTTPVAQSTNVKTTQLSASNTIKTNASNTIKTNSTISTNSASTTPSVKCSSATITATSSTTISYNGPSTTVKTTVQGSNASASPKTTTGSNASATIKATTGSNASTTIKATTKSNPSATVKAASGNNASATTKTTAGSSTSSTTKNASATPTASTTPYAYLAHMGGEAKYQVASILKKLELYNGNLENNKADDKELDIALKKFRDEFRVKTTSLYSEEMVEAIKKVGSSLTKLSTVKSQLAELDFYDQNGKEKIDPLDITGKNITNNYVEGLRNFSRLYNVEFSSENIDKVLGKLKDVNDMYHQVVNQAVEKKVDSETVVPEQSKSFGKMWTFFKLGMGVSDKVAAALMGNSFAESRLNEGQVQSTAKDLDNYQYQLNDGIGYGLFQWTFPSRKNSLIEIAKSMNMGINNINAQLETLKNEVLYSNDHKDMWIEMNNVDDCNTATKIFFDVFELVKDSSLDRRIRAANDILKIMS